MPDGEKIRHARPSARRAKRRHRARWLPRGRVLKGTAPRVSWFPAAAVLIVTAVIAIAVTLVGGKGGPCTHMQGLTCVSKVSVNPSARHPG